MASRRARTAESALRRPNRALRGRAQEPPKRPAFHVTPRRAGGGVPQSIAHRAKLADPSVELVGFRSEQFSIDARRSMRREHARDLIEREAGGAPEGDEREALDHAGVEEASQAAPARRRDEPLRLVEPQRGGRNARAPRHLGDVQIPHSLDLKSA